MLDLREANNYKQWQRGRYSYTDEIPSSPEASKARCFMFSQIDILIFKLTIYQSILINFETQLILSSYFTTKNI